MMRKYWLLLKIQLLSLFSINKMFYSHDKREKGRLIGMSIAWFIVLAVLVMYSTLTAYGYVQLGIVHALPAIMLLICSLITIVLTFMKSNGVLFGLRDYDMVMSLPVSVPVVVLSRLSMVYLMNLLISFIAIAPSIVIYGINTGASFSIYVMLALTLFLAPMIPMILAMAVGALITAVSIRFRQRNIFALILSLVAALLVMYFSMSVQNVDMEELTDFGLAVNNMVNSYYPPAQLLTNAIAHNDWINYALFALISIGVFVLFVAITAKFYSKINTAMFSYSKRNDYRISELKSTNPFIALYQKELRRLFSCTTYALNCCFGAVLVIVAGIALLAANPELILAYFGLDYNTVETYIQCVPFALSMFIGMSSTTCVALSLEGKYRWLMCSAPVKSETIFNSKIAVSLTVLLPASFIGGLLFSLALKADFITAFFMVLIPLVFSFFISVIGMLFNAKFPKYDWTSEYHAIKGGSASLLLTMLVGMILPLVLLWLSLVFVNEGLIVQMLSVCFIALATYVVYQRLIRIRVYA